MNEEIDNYVERCLYLQKSIGTMSLWEDSPRVWAAVMIEIVKNICRNGDDPKRCLEQFIDALKKSFEDEENE
jgi:hypothetical protein